MVFNGLPLLVIGLLLVTALRRPDTSVGAAILISGAVLLVGALLPWRRIVKFKKRL